MTYIIESDIVLSMRLFYEIISINLFNKYFLSTYYFLGAPLCAGSTAVNKQMVGLLELTFSERVRQTLNTYITRAIGREHTRSSDRERQRGGNRRGSVLKDNGRQGRLFR